MSYRLGLDIGIGSVGFSVLKTDDHGRPYKIIKLDSLVFPEGENPKDGSSLAATRRAYRSSRRLNRRRKFRKYRVKRLFINNGLLTKQQINQIFKQKPLPSVYQLRVNGLKKRLTNSELFQVLYFLAGHRGFKSNRKYARKSTGPLLKSIQKSKTDLKKHGYRTMGEMVLKNPKFAQRKRNHGQNDYLVTASRSMIDDEARQIFNEQQKLNNDNLSNHFIHQYLKILDSQRNYDMGPAKPSPYAGNQIEKMIGRDSLDHSQPRAAKGTYTFEYFNLLSRLNNLKYKSSLKSYWQPLDQNQRQAVIDLAFKLKKVNYFQIRKKLNLYPNAKFNLVRYNLRSFKSPEQAEVKTTFIQLKAIHEIGACLPDNLKVNVKLIDAIGEILSKYASDETRRKHFQDELGQLPDSVIEHLLDLNYSQFGKLSLRTMRKLIPYLQQGYLYNEAAQKAGYDFKKRRINEKYVQENVKNPVVLRAFSMTRKVVRAVIRHYGKPDAINIELARNLAKNWRERRQIEERNNRFQKINQRAAERLRSNGFPVNGQNIIISKLYNEQDGIDPYTGEKMDYQKVFNGNGNYYNIDHIVPYSWTFDDSYTNKILVSTKANEEKGNRLPMQYLANRPGRVNFLIHFANNRIKNIRKRAHLVQQPINPKKLAEWRDEWKSRNLNDTRYLNKLIANYLRQNVTFSDNSNLGKERVVSLNGGMTAKMRSRWGIQKYVSGGYTGPRNFGDLNHGVDATVIASVTPTLINQINRFSKYQEIKYNRKLWDPNSTEYQKLSAHPINKVFKDLFNDFPLPWHDFRHELLGRADPDPAKAMSGYPWRHYTPDEVKRLKPAYVIHRASHKINGQVNLDTKRSAKYLKQGKVMQRFSVKDLKLNKKGQIKKSNYVYFDHPDGGNQAVKQQLVSQMKMHGYSGKKAFPNGMMRFRDRHGHVHVIRKVQMLAKYKNGVLSHDRNSVSQNGKIVRIDVFSNQKRYFYVPIYLKDVLKPKLPDVIASAGKKIKRIKPTDHFEFSLYPYTPVHIKFKKPKTAVNQVNKSKNKISEFWGYYVNPSVNVSAINLISMNNVYKIVHAGVGQLPLFEKLNINYLGEIHRVHEKKRVSFLRLQN